jgi:hypothetical protein
VFDAEPIRQTGHKTVSFLGWNWSVRDNDGAVEIKDEKADRWFKISELYARERLAELALIEAQEKALRSLITETNKLRDTHGFLPLRLRTQTEKGPVQP